MPNKFMFFLRNFKSFLLLLIPYSLLAQNSLKQIEDSPRHNEWVILSSEDKELNPKES